MTDLFEATLNEADNRLRIKKVTLENYRNFTYQEIFLDGDSVVFSGKNELGKTNIIESIFYALDNRLFNGMAKNDKIRIKPDGSDNDTKTSIKVEFIKDNFTIEKVVFENWTKKTNEYKGTETAYYINGATVKQNSQAVSLLMDYLGLSGIEARFKGTELENIDLIALMYNTQYLKTIDYKLMRKLVIDMVGEVQPKDVINSNPTKYGRLVEPLKQHNMELETLKIAKRTEVNGDKNKKGLKETIEIQEGIKQDYETKANVELDMDEIELAKKELTKLELEIGQLQVDLTKSGSELTRDIELKIAKKTIELNEAKANVLAEYNKQIANSRDEKLEKEIKDKEESLNKLRDERTTINEKISKIEGERSTLNISLQSKERTIKDKSEKKDGLATEYQALKNGSAEKTSEEITCPHCDKPFHLHESKEHQTILNNKLQSIKQKGIALKGEIEVLKEGSSELLIEIEKKNQAILKLQKERDELDTKGLAIKAEYSQLKEKAQNVVVNKPTINYDVEPILTLQKELNALQDEKNTLISNVSETQSQNQLKLVGLREKKQQLQSVAQKEEIKLNDMKRVEEKKIELEALYSQLQSAKEILLLISDLEKDMYEILDSKVHNVFGDNFGFQLYRQNIDGSYDTRLCDVFVKNRKGQLISLETINTGTYHKRAIEFISKIKEHYNLPKSFVFVDELSNLDTEHRKELLQFGEQIIATMMTDTDKIEKVVLK